MHKDFYTVIKGNENDLWNTRIYSLLNRFKLSNRIIHVGDLFGFYSPCTFDAFDHRIDDYRESSKLFLMNSIIGY